jgi:hypothetical protein
MDLAEKITDAFNHEIKTYRESGADPTGAEVNHLRAVVRKQLLAGVAVIIRQGLRAELVASADENADLYKAWPGLRHHIR